MDIVKQFCITKKCGYSVLWVLSMGGAVKTDKMLYNNPVFNLFAYTGHGYLS